MSFSPQSAILKIAKTLGTSLFRTDPVPYLRLGQDLKQLMRNKGLTTVKRFEYWRSWRSYLFTVATLPCQLCFHSIFRQSHCQVPEVLFNIHQTIKTKYDFLALRKGLNSIYMTSISIGDSLGNNNFILLLVWIFINLLLYLFTLLV